MKAKLHLVFSISIFLMAFYGWSQDNYWKPVVENKKYDANASSDPSTNFQLETKTFQQALETSIQGKGKNLVFFPKASGELIGFTIAETAVFHSALAAKYPLIKSYTGWSIDKKHKIRFSVSHRGVQAMLLDSNTISQTTFIEKDKNSGTYKAFVSRNSLTAKTDFACETSEFNEAVTSTIEKSIADNQLLRVYRIAVSATGEYTQYHGGTIADALAAINATLTRVNEVFETDLSIRLELVANNDLVIFTDATTDPYTNNLNNQSQQTLSALIGEENYDVGHVFQQGTNSGDAGFIGAVCLDNRKGSAFSSGENPEGDMFDIDFVAHELGHQFGANHTWSFENEGTGVQAEPASGTTIMGYAGIATGNDVAPNSDDYFHFNSILQISNYVQTISCGQNIALSNSAPAVSSLDNYTIPIGTAFVLEGEATDIDTEDVLTYTWEQIDDGVVVTSTFGPENVNGANFRSQRPTTDPIRYFPKLTSIVSGDLIQTNPSENSAWETVSNITREFNFALTVRDNAVGGGQVTSTLTTVNTINNAGPFEVTSQTTNKVYAAGSFQEVTWNVANTNIAPIATEFVAIYMSYDGGVSFPLLLADNVPNTGSTQIQIPGQATTSARLMIKAIDNVFLAVNTTDFTIEERDVVLNFQELNFETCKPNDIVVPFTFETYGGFNEEVAFSVTNMPSGLVENFSPNITSTNGEAVAILFSNTENVSAGIYAIKVIGTATSFTTETTINIAVRDDNFSEVVLLAPENDEINTRVNPQLEWQSNDNVSEYAIEIAADESFANIVETATVTFSFYQTTNLQPETNYFWRVKPMNNCGEGVFGNYFSFTTAPISCVNSEGDGFPIEISSGNPSINTATIRVLQDQPIADLNVDLSISHSFLEDLIITLTSPEGTTVTLFSKNCGNRNNINVFLDDDGAAINCSNSTPAIGGTVKPLGVLSSFNGESPLGDWVLQVEDTANGDGGSLDAFSLELCLEGNVFNFISKNESCPGEMDASLEIIPSDSTLFYTAVLEGNGINRNANFTDVFLFDNLVAGTYQLCITGVKDAVVVTDQCQEITITEPNEFNVTSEFLEDELQVRLTVEGSDSYTVNLNGIITEIETSNAVLDLAQGKNTIRVSTALSCQGFFEEIIYVSPRIYPNPFEDRLSVFLASNALENITTLLYNSEGRLVYQKSEGIDGTTLELDLSAFSTGLYYLKLLGTDYKEEFKVLKR